MLDTGWLILAPPKRGGRYVGGLGANMFDPVYKYIKDMIS